MTILSDAFEIKATLFLNDWITPLIPNVSFFREGGKSGYVKDIKVLYGDIEKELFWISAKLSNAQGGQIVALKNSAGKYQLSGRSHKPVKDNFVTRKVIEHLNENLSYYADKEKNKGVFKDPDLITEWFKNQAIVKDERFLIFPDKRNFIHAIPFCSVDNIFKITGNFRPKPSGPTSIPNKMKNPSYTKDHIIKLAIGHLLMFGIEVIGHAVAVEKHTVLNLNKSRDCIPSEKYQYFGDNLFYMSFEPPSEFQVRLVKLSHTANPNVMTLLKLNDNICIPDNGFELLKNEIEKEIGIRKL